MTDDSKYTYQYHGENKKIAVIHLKQNLLGGDEAMSFAEALNDASRGGAEVLVADMSKVEMINSTGLGMLVNGLSNLKKRDAKLVLAAVPDKVNRLLVMTHLDRVFELYETSAAAIEANIK